MKMAGTMRGLASAALLLGAMGLVGCETSGGTSSGQPTGVKSGPRGTLDNPAWERMQAAKAEPAPAKPAEQPRATGNCRNYRPAMPAGYGMAQMAFPTGDVNTSAVMVQQVMPQVVRKGTPYTYEIHVTNVSATELQNVVVDLEALNNQTVQSSTPAATSGQGGPMWNLGNMASCETKVIKVTALANTAGQASSNCLQVSYNNVLCSATQVVEPALSITKAITPEALICDPINMTVEVKNTGTGTASNVRWTDALPAGLTTSDGKTNLDIVVGDLAQGQSKSFPVQLKAARTGRFENTANATADGGLTARSNTVATVVKAPKLELSCTAPQNVLLNRNITYTIKVKNSGDGACANASITSPLPGNAAFVSADNGGVQSAGGVTWNLGTLAPGAEKTVTVTVRATGMGNVAMSASANCACPAPATTSCSTAVTGSPDMVTLLDDAEGVVNVGDLHNLRYEVGNQGQVDLTNIVVNITLPEGIEYVSSTSGVQPTISGRTLTFKAANALKPGERRSYTLTVRATKAMEALMTSETKCDQLRSTVRDDEVTVFIDK